MTERYYILKQSMLTFIPFNLLVNMNIYIDTLVIKFAFIVHRALVYNVIFILNVQ